MFSSLTTVYRNQFSVSLIVLLSVIFGTSSKEVLAAVVFGHGIHNTQVGGYSGTYSLISAPYPRLYSSEYAVGFVGVSDTTTGAYMVAGARRTCDNAGYCVGDAWYFQFEPSF